MAFPFHPLDTSIAAPITAPGIGAVAIVRLSGRDALSIAQGVCRRPLPLQTPHRLTRCALGLKEQEPFDEGLVAIMPAPHSFTGQNAVEFHLHGNPLIVRKLLQALEALGAEIAQPGEFTYRAFALGKIDLAQAEAVADLLRAQSERALVGARRQLAGGLSERLGAILASLMRWLTLMEGQLDFPDEVPAKIDRAQLDDDLARSLRDLVGLEEGARRGTWIQRGLSACLIGRPNVGKSSLLNALLGRDRAIVTSVPGTTRDFIEEPHQIAGLHVRLIDTAGIRGGALDPAEREGMRRTREVLEGSEIALLILDASAGMTGEDRELLAQLDPAKTILVWNKIDLASPPEIQWEALADQSANPWTTSTRCARVCAREAGGVAPLQEQLRDLLETWLPSEETGAELTNARQAGLARSARERLESALIELRADNTSEIVAQSLREACDQLAAIRGDRVAPELLGGIFATFCLGK